VLNVNYWIVGLIMNKREYIDAFEAWINAQFPSGSWSNYYAKRYVSYLLSDPIRSHDLLKLDCPSMHNLVKSEMKL